MSFLPKTILEKHRLQIGLSLTFLVLLGGGVLILMGNRAEPSGIEKFDGTVSSASEPSEATASSESAPTLVIKVDVSGAINKPGVYELPEGGRVEEALNAAGGLSEQADKDWVAKNLNLAAKLHDGDKLYIPKIEEISSTPTNPTPQTTAGVTSGIESSPTSSESLNCDRVNINTASVGTLDECLSGIGPAYAQNIIEYREAHGGFKAIEEIQEVRGIGPKTFGKIRDQITVD